MPLKRLKPEMGRLPKPQQYFLCPSPMLSLAHLLHFSLCRLVELSQLPRRHICSIFIAPKSTCFSPHLGEDSLYQSLCLFLCLSPPTTPPLNSHPSQPIPKLLGKGLGLAQLLSLPGPINHRLDDRLVLYTRG